MTDTKCATAPDVRNSDAWRDVHAFYSDLFAPGSGHVAMLRDIAAAPDGGAYFTGLSFGESLEPGPRSALYRFDAALRGIERVCEQARLGRPSPDGVRIAYVEGGRVVLRKIDATEVIDAVKIDGLIEQLSWSPDGSQLAMLVAGARADVSGAEGGFALAAPNEGPDWLPEIDTGDADDVWRRLYLWNAAEAPRALTAPPVNVWEFSWAGPDALAIIASDHHGEASWYTASLRRVDAESGAVRELHRGADQLALPRAARDGGTVAFVEAVCSDRGIVCGTLKLLDGDGVRAIDTGTTEVSDLHWASPSRIVFAGLRGLETVVGDADLVTGEHRDLWAATDRTCGEWHPSIALAHDGAVLMATEAWASAPALVRLCDGQAETLHDCAAAGSAGPAGAIEPVRWRASDGLEIEGWLIRNPLATEPAPLLIDIHGGPIWAYRNRWAARLRAAGVLVAKGWSVLLPNMRGAPGRGQDFARRVVKDMGGADTQDILSGIDHLVAQGTADPDRIAVTGASYGGFMSAWLVTQTNRLAAAVPISPVTNWYSQHYTSQIPSFDELCLEGAPNLPGGQYFDRSPVFAAAGATTPTLTLAGERDKNTPPTQALEFHRALLETGCVSALCTYPADGHSLRGYPAYLDSAARTILWIERHTER